ncbi:hypothetical protein OUZ56_016997 [Daphnia magna]|uniref:Uncharacterized protein n=1 Tax=Daphnia magna TaxID=35525 RepID=A0ABR0ARW1_9CRUS|nr:hypothetical protein OUZ56_016997 [Daphnia magna]
MGNPDALLNDRDGAGRRQLVDSHKESEDSVDEDNNVKIERFFEVQNANFLQRKANRRELERVQFAAQHSTITDLLTQMILDTSLQTVDRM